MLDLKDTIYLYKKLFGENSAILLLLSFVYASLATLFVECDIYQEQLLAIVGSDTFVLTRLLELLRIFENTKALSLASDTKTFFGRLQSVKDDFAICSFLTSSKANHNAETLEELFLSHTVNDQTIYSLVAIFFNGVIPPEKAGNYLAVDLELCGDNSKFCADITKFKNEFVSACNSRVSTVLDIIKTFSSSNRSLMPNAWIYAAADVLLVICGCRPSDASAYDSLMNEIENALQTSTSLQDFDGISELVIRCLYDYASQCRMPMVNINDLAEHEVTDLDTVPFCDSDFYYFPDNLFREICKPLFTSLTYGQINESLNTDGIQISQGCKRTFSTSKVTMVNVYGATIRKRMHKLAREKTDLPFSNDLETAFKSDPTHAKSANSSDFCFSNEQNVYRIRGFQCPEGGDDYE